jgi:hypothetical protein
MREEEGVEGEEAQCHQPLEGEPMIRKHLIGAVGAALLAMAMIASPALGSQQIQLFETSSSTTQAGGHPDLTTSFRLADPGNPEAARNVVFNAPEGIFGNPNATTRCTQADFAQQSCPANAQVGLMTVRAAHNGDPNSLLGTVPIFSLEPGDHQTALFAVIAPTVNIPILIPVDVRTGSDYGLRFTVSEVSQTSPIARIDFTLWGFPALESHRAQRFAKGSPGKPAGCPLLFDASCNPAPGTKSTDTPKPLTSNPTVCTGQPLVSRLSVQTYQDGANLTHAESTYPPITGCEKTTFTPVLHASPTTNETDSASGLDLTLRAPQFLTFAAAPSQIKSVTVTLPPGLNINPDAADGQGMCTDDQANFGRDVPSDCPDNAKIGTYEIETPSLDDPLVGSLYIGEPKPGVQYRLFMIANGAGINSKLVSTLHPDPQTGQLRFQTQQLPQVTFEEFRLHLFASDRGLLATPTHCTIYRVDAQFFPWNDEIADQTSSQVFGLNAGPGGAPCPGQIRPFKPRLVAGSSNPVAGAFSDFALKLDRDDGDQFLGDLNFKMPPGFTGDLRGISYCPESAIAQAAETAGRTEQVTPSCPAQSLIGSSNVAAGPGSHPFHAVGKMYLAGPLKGAPLSLVAITPALAGPYDYGNVVVRVALHIDPLTAQVSAMSERMPQIIGGIPIRMRSIKVNIDRPDFTINPTNCDAMTVDSQGIGDQGTVTDFSSYFNAVNCATLPFKPKMTVRQVGKKGTRRSQNPRLQFDLRTRTGDANIKTLSVTLSHAFEIDQRHLGNICSEKELTEKQCAGRTPIGQATTTTPLLDEPLAGAVYAVSGSGGLPRLAFVLNGQVNLVPRADTETTSRGQLKTTVPVVPDAPIGHFRMTVFGGKTGYLINTRDICAHPPMTDIAYTAQNGKTTSQRAKLAMPGCKKKTAKKKRTRRHG